MNRMVPLAKIARPALGYRTLQNDFFFVDRATIDSFEIEAEYLTPITTFAQLNANRYRQQPGGTTWVFVCREQEGDLRGTGALDYIRAMADRPAAMKYQTGRTPTIAETLAAQGCSPWYAPKASPRPAKVWLRKTIGSVHAPFVFANAAVVDQHCHSLVPLAGVTWEELAAVTTSTLFAYGVEINGAATLGAGTLDVATTKLRYYPAFDPRGLSAAERRELVNLARSVWAGEAQPDWLTDRKPGPRLCDLDAWLLALSGSKLKPETVYADLAAACAARNAVATDRVPPARKTSVANLAGVARGIADKERRTLNRKRFPEHFVDERRPSQPIDVEAVGIRRIRLEPSLDQASVAIFGEGGQTLFHGTYRSCVAEAIVRALLMGRQSFRVPTQPGDAEAAVAGFLAWFDGLRLRLKAAIDEQAFGTGDEAELRAEVYRRLGIHPLAGERALPPEIDLAGIETPAETAVAQTAKRARSKP